jgi:YfiH family protein
MNSVKTHHTKNTIDGSVRETGFLTIAALDKESRLLHAFTTRHGDLGARSNGARHNDDWTAMAHAFGIRIDRLATVNQVHGENIVKVDEMNIREVRTMRADAMISRVPGIAIGVETADCVPVLLYDPVTQAVAAVHAGWRSTVKKIVQKTVNRMHEEFDTEASRLIAAIGPAIGQECYEVDEPVMGPVRDAFSFWQEVSTPRGTDRWGLDLVKANKLELMQIGLDEKNIHSAGMCTACRKDRFYSFRAEGKTGRMLSVIMLKP